VAVCYSRGVKRSSKLCKGVERLGVVIGLDETEKRWGARALVPWLWFGRSKAWAGCDGPWAVIFVLVGGFAVKMGYPILLVPDTWFSWISWASVVRAFASLNIVGHVIH
jgi:hypothetical protein